MNTITISLPELLSALSRKMQDENRIIGRKEMIEIIQQECNDDTITSEEIVEYLETELRKIEWLKAEFKKKESRLRDEYLKIQMKK